jgi:hypothetical protein
MEQHAIIKKMRLQIIVYQHTRILALLLLNTITEFPTNAGGTI